MRRARRKGANKEKVFGCDLLEHLAASGHEIPQVLRSCSEFIELHGIVDGIYRLSGVSSNIQKLRSEFDSEGSPDLNKDLYLQDIHCVSSLCKAYFRELPNPLLTYQLYDKFAEAVAIQLEEERLVKIRDVLKELPPLHHRTLEFLMRHLVRVASYSSETNMHSRNLAIVWAPNLLRSKDIEASGFNGTAAFMEVRVQSIVVEFILTHVSQLFPEQGASLERRKSLPSPSVLPNLEEPFFRTVPSPSNFGHISPGDGPLAIRPYHAIIEGTDKRKGSLKGRKWMSIFNIGGRFHDPRRRNKNSSKEKDRPVLRPARSMDSLSSPSYPKEGSRHPAQRPPSTHMSPLVIPSPQVGAEVGASAGAVGGSGYAVTYRRGTGVVSGGTQGTYHVLDPEGSGATADEGKPHQSRSPGVTSKRRAAMHITGPHLVTVPLHITSNLALGVLQGGGGDRVIHCRKDKDGGDRVEGKGEGEKEERKDGKEMERKKEDGGVTAMDVKEDKNNGGNAIDKEAGDEKGGAEVEGGGAEGKVEGAKEDEREEEAMREDDRLKTEEEAGGRGESGEQDGKRLNSSTEEDNDDEYMDMHGAEPVTPAVPGSPASQTSVCGADSVSPDILNSTEVDEDDQEMSGYVQDNFDFLDHMDCSVSSQMIEFSVEPPGYEDDEYEVMEQQPSCRLPPAPTPIQSRPLSAPDTQIQAQFNSHRPLTTDIHGRHVKSLSLPYMTLPFLPAQFSSSEEGVDNDDDDDDYSNDEDDMFYKSLPSGYIFDDVDWHDGVPYPSPSSPPQSPLSRRTVDRVDQSQSSEDRQPEPLDVEASACNEPPMGNQEQGEVEGEEVLEKKDEGEEEAEDNVNQEEEQEGQNMQIQSTATQEDLHPVDDVDVMEDDPDDTEKPTTCCVAFPPPRTEDNDGTDTEANMKVEDEKEVVESLRSNGEESAGGHFDDTVDEIDGNVLVTFARRKVFCVAQREIVDVSTEVPRKFSVRPLEPPKTYAGRGWGEQREEREEDKVDEELEDRIGGRKERTGLETAVATEDIQESDKNRQEEQTERGGEETPDEERGGKGQEVDKEQDDAHIWEEFENFICDMIENEESVNAEKKDVSDGAAGEEKTTGDVIKVGEDDEQIGRVAIEMEKVAIVREGAKVSEEGMREEEEQIGRVTIEMEKVGIVREGAKVSEEGMREEEEEEEGVIIKTEVEKEALEEPTEEKHKTQQDSETKEKHPAKDSESKDENEAGESEIREKVEEEKMPVHQQPEEAMDSKAQENEDKERRQPLSTLDEKEKRMRDVETDIKQSKESELKKRNSSRGSEAGVGRKIVVSRQAPPKLHQVKSVPVVPPKPQHCRLTALGLRQQQQRETRDGDRERGNVVRQNKDPEREREKACDGEKGKDGEREDESRGEKEKHAPKGGERERRRDGDEGGTRDPTRHSAHSMCFDEAVAIATMRRGKEKESERERERQRDWGHEVQQ